MITIEPIQIGLKILFGTYHIIVISLKKKYTNGIGIKIKNTNPQLQKIQISPLKYRSIRDNYLVKNIKSTNVLP